MERLSTALLGRTLLPTNPQFAIKIAWEIWHFYDDIVPFIQTARVLEKALNTLPLSRRADLIWIDPVNPHPSYGFTDVVAKTGEELFSSLLLYEAHIKIAELYRTIGRFGEAENKLGQFMRKYRNRLVISEKTLERTSEGAWRELRTTLSRFNVEYLDISVSCRQYIRGT